MIYRIFAALVTAAMTTVSNADPIDPCSLLSDADMIEIGLPSGSQPSHENQPGGVQACKYQAQRGPAGISVSIILSEAVPERVLQLRALRAKALGENARAQLEARGEYFGDSVMCKLASASQLESSQCLGTTEQSVVGFMLVRPTQANAPVYPTAQLRLTATLVSRVAAKGG